MTTSSRLALLALLTPPSLVAGPNNSPWSWLTIPWSEYEDSEHNALIDRLQSFTMNELRQLAKEHGWKLKGTNKAEICAQIAKYIADPGCIQEAFRTLNVVQRQALYSLLLGCSMTSAQPDDLKRLSGLWGSQPDLDALIAAVESLPSTALTFSPSWSNTTTLPYSVARHLPPALEGVVATLLPSDAKLTGAGGERSCFLALGDYHAFVRTVNLLVLLIEHTGAALQPGERPVLEAQSHGVSSFRVPLPPRALAQETVTRLASVAGGEVRLDFICSLLIASGLLRSAGPAILVNRDVQQQFLARDEKGQFARLARFYLHAASQWSELWELLRNDDQLQIRRSIAFLMGGNRDLTDDLHRLRQLVLRTLACLPEYQWIAWAEVERVMRTVWPHFEQMVSKQSWGGEDAWFLATTTPRSDKLRRLEASDWDRVQGAFVRQVLCGPLHWLGLADLAQRDGQLVAVRLQGLADLYWNRAELPTLARDTDAAGLPGVPHSPQPVVRFDQHTIRVVPTAISGQAHGLLLKIARLEATFAEEFVYRLDAKTVYQTYEAQVTLDDLLNDWGQLFSVPLSSAIREQLTSWWNAYGHVRLYEHLAVIEFGDDYALSEVKAATTLARVLIAELSPRLVVIPNEAVADLLNQLKKAGYTPAQTEQI